MACVIILLQGTLGNLQSKESFCWRLRTVNMAVKTFHGKKARIVGTLIGLLLTCIGAWIIFGDGSLLLGLILFACGVIELGRILIQSDYSFTIEHGTRSE